MKNTIVLAVAGPFLLAAIVMRPKLEKSRSTEPRVTVRGANLLQHEKQQSGREHHRAADEDRTSVRGGSAPAVPVIPPALQAMGDVDLKENRVPPLPENVWVHEGDSDGDGLRDEFELMVGLDPHQAYSFHDGIADEDRLDARGRSMWQAQ